MTQSQLLTWRFSKGVAVLGLAPAVAAYLFAAVILFTIVQTVGLSLT